MYSLLADDSDSSDKLLPLMMMQGQGEFNPMMSLQSTDMNSLLPLTLLDDSSDGSSSTLKDLLPLMMMSGQGMGDMQSMLPMLLLSDSSSDIKDLLPFMLMNGQSGNMNSMLPLLMMGDSDLDSDLLMMMMLGQTQIQA